MDNIASEINILLKNVEDITGMIDIRIEKEIEDKKIAGDKKASLRAYADVVDIQKSYSENLLDKINDIMKEK